MHSTHRTKMVVMIASCLALAFFGRTARSEGSHNPSIANGQAPSESRNDVSDADFESTDINPEINYALVPPDARVEGKTYTEWSENWWRWLISIPADKNPALHLDENCDVNQSDDKIFYLSTYGGAATYTRTCNVVGRKFILFTTFAYLNDYPCPDPSFHPEAGQTLGAFLRVDATDFIDGVRFLQITVDGAPISGTDDFRFTTSLFDYIGDTSLQGPLDPCITGTAQPAVSDGYFFMLRPLAPGHHTVHVTARSPFGRNIDVTYKLNVTRR